MDSGEAAGQPASPPGSDTHTLQHILGQRAGCVDKVQGRHLEESAGEKLRFQSPQSSPSSQECGAHDPTCLQSEQNAGQSFINSTQNVYIQERLPVSNRTEQARMTTNQEAAMPDAPKHVHYSFMEHINQGPMSDTILTQASQLLGPVSRTPSSGETHVKSVPELRPRPLDHLTQDDLGPGKKTQQDSDGNMSLTTLSSHTRTHAVSFSPRVGQRVEKFPAWVLCVFFYLKVEYNLGCKISLM